MLAEKDINVQKFFTNDKRWCVNRTVVPEKRLFTPPQMTRKYTVTSKYRWRMDKLRLSEEQNKATTVCYQPMFIMWNVQVVSLLRVIHFTLNSPHGCKHACVEPCSLVLLYLVQSPNKSRLWVIISESSSDVTLYNCTWHVITNLKILIRSIMSTGCTELETFVFLSSSI